MSRHPLPPGTAGNIKATQLGARQWKARCRYRDTAGYMHWPERYGNTRAQAVNRLREAIRDFDAPVPGAQLSGKSKLAEVAAVVRAEMVADGRAESTIKAFDQRVRVHLLPALGQLALSEITTGRVDTFFRRKKAELAPNTVAGIRDALSLIFSAAVRAGAAKFNPVSDARQITGRSKPVRWLDKNQRLALLRALDADGIARRADLPDLCRFMLGTGMRISEALAVTWDDIDLDADPPRVTAGPHLIDAERVDEVRRTEEPKSHSSTGVRTLPVPDFLTVVLLSRLAGASGTGQPQSLLTTSGAMVGRPVFPIVNGRNIGKWRSPRSTGASFRSALDRAGFKWATSHTFRKTAATAWSEAGLSPREVADLLGHTRISMTDTYIGRSLQVHPTAAKLLDKAMFDEEADS